MKNRFQLIECSNCLPFRFDTRRVSFAKAQNRFADCFIRQIVPDSLHIPWFWFQTFSLINILILFSTIMSSHKQSYTS